MPDEPVPKEPKDSSYPLLDFLRKEKRTLKSAPLSILTLVAIGWGIVFWFEERHYGVTIIEKDATITAKDAVISQISAERDGYRNQLEDAGIVSRPLKKTALILSEQLLEFSEHVETNNSPFDIGRFDDRFSLRINKVVSDLDEHGRHSDKIDKNAGYRVWNVNNSMARTQIMEMATEIKGLAEGLKD